MITHSISRQIENFVVFLVVILWVGLVGWLVGKAGSKNTLSKVLNPQKKASSKNQSDFWKMGKKLQIK